ncbi:MAG: PspC domain-containing protein [Streptosporangiaceae bacterium]
MNADNREPRSSSRLTRGDGDRIVGGVCAGLARRTDIDPVIYRVAFGVLAFVQGLGLVLYGLGWLLLPAEAKAEPSVRRLLRGQLDTGIVAALAVLVLGLVVGPTFFFVHDPAAPLIALGCVVGLVLLIAHRRGARISDLFGAVRHEPGEYPSASEGPSPEGRSVRRPWGDGPSG